MNEQAQAIFAENVIGVLATVNEDGSPWATPLHIVADDAALYWFSAADRAHSANVVRDSRVHMTLFSPDTSGGLKGVYVSGSAELLDAAGHAATHELLTKRLGTVPPAFAGWDAYRLPIGTLDEQKSTGSCWYFYS